MKRIALTIVMIIAFVLCVTVTTLDHTKTAQARGGEVPVRITCSVFGVMDPICADEMCLPCDVNILTACIGQCTDNGGQPFVGPSLTLGEGGPAPCAEGC
jgi:hypothetical protein